MVQHSGPNPRIWKVQMVFVTFPKLHGPMSKLMAWKLRVQEVSRWIRQGPPAASVRGPHSTQTCIHL